MKKRKLIKMIGVTLLLCTSIYSTLGCSNYMQSEEIQQGFYTDLAGEQTPAQSSNQIAFKSDKSVFDIEDVTLTFGFGWICTADATSDKSYHSIPKFDILFSNDKEYSVLAKHIDDEFYSLNFAITANHSWNDEHTEILRTEHNFTHTESLTIPKELFTDNEGYISVLLMGDVSYIANSTNCFASTVIYYTKDGNNVKLYDSWHDWYYR